jgi:hypothetical protein
MQQYRYISVRKKIYRQLDGRIIKLIMENNMNRRKHEHYFRDLEQAVQQLRNAHRL